MSKKDKYQASFIQNYILQLKAFISIIHELNSFKYKFIYKLHNLKK